MMTEKMLEYDAYLAGKLEPAIADIGEHDVDELEDATVAVCERFADRERPRRELYYSPEVKAARDAEMAVRKRGLTGPEKKAINHEYKLRAPIEPYNYLTGFKARAGGTKNRSKVVPALKARIGRCARFINAKTTTDARNAKNAGARKKKHRKGRMPFDEEPVLTASREMLSAARAAGDMSYRDLPKALPCLVAPSGRRGDEIMAPAYEYRWDGPRSVHVGGPFGKQEKEEMTFTTLMPAKVWLGGLAAFRGAYEALVARDLRRKREKLGRELTDEEAGAQRNVTQDRVQTQANRFLRVWDATAAINVDHNTKYRDDQAGTFTVHKLRAFHVAVRLAEPRPADVNDLEEVPFTMSILGHETEESARTYLIYRVMTAEEKAAAAAAREEEAAGSAEALEAAERRRRVRAEKQRMRLEVSDSESDPEAVEDEDEDVEDEAAEEDEEEDEDEDEEAAPEPTAAERKATREAARNTRRIIKAQRRARRAERRAARATLEALAAEGEAAESDEPSTPPAPAPVPVPSAEQAAAARKAKRNARERRKRQEDREAGVPPKKRRRGNENRDPQTA